MADPNGGQLATVVWTLQNRPKKSLAYQTPAEVFNPSQGRLLRLTS